MTDTRNHDDPTLVKYTPASYQYAALRRKFEPKLISPYGLQYDRRQCAKEWDRDEARDAPFNCDHFQDSPQGAWNPISLGQMIKSSERFLISRRRLKRVKRRQSGYGMKHEIEREGKTYVVNGAVIVAAVQFGLIVKPIRHGAASAFFNIGARLNAKVASSMSQLSDDQIGGVS
jgi:hypothetical protein